MKSMRLNHESRSVIIKAALADCKQFTDESIEKERKKFIKQWGLPFYRALYDAKTRRKMNSLPAGALPEARAIDLYLPGSVLDNARHLKEHMSVYLGEYMPVFASHTGKWVMIENLPIYDEWDWQGMWEAWQVADVHAASQARYQMEVDLMNFLKQFTTTKQVYDNWPEGRKYLPQAISETKALIISPESINKTLGLPK